jgi:hypothetical protein
MEEKKLKHFRLAKKFHDYLTALAQIDLQSQRSVHDAVPIKELSPVHQLVGI